jgi:hypothetical protein
MGYPFIEYWIKVLLYLSFHVKALILFILASKGINSIFIYELLSDQW